MDIRAVQELMGHSESETTAKYLHSDTRTKQAVVGRLDGLLGSSPEPVAEAVASNDGCDGTLGEATAGITSGT